jgi:hypothetical protein
MKHSINTICRLVAGIGLCMGISASTFSQNVATADLVWRCDQATEQRTSSTISHNSTFKTSGTRSVVWLQRNDQFATTFTVTGTQGTWGNISNDGSFTYLLRRDGATGRMTVQRSGTNVSITLDFNESGEHNVSQKFRVQSVQPSN